MRGLLAAIAGSIMQGATAEPVQAARMAARIDPMPVAPAAKPDAPRDQTTPSACNFPDVPGSSLEPGHEASLYFLNGSSKGGGSKL